MTRLNMLAATALSLCAFAACKPPPLEAVVVVVYQTTQRCTIKDQPVDCAQVAAYLRDTLKIKPERQVVVSFTGADSGSKEDPILDAVAAEVRTAGFKDVRTARFDFK